MPTPGKHKTVQARILGYSEAIGWTFVSREEPEQRRGFDPDVPATDRTKNRSLFFDDLLDTKVGNSTRRYAEAEGALIGQFRHLHTDHYGNRFSSSHRIQGPQAMIALTSILPSILPGILPFWQDTWRGSRPDVVRGNRRPAGILPIILPIRQVSATRPFGRRLCPDRTI